MLISSCAATSSQTPGQTSRAVEVPEAPPAWMLAIVERQQTLIALNGPVTNPKLQAELLHMQASDQASRAALTVQSPDKKTLDLSPEMVHNDALLTSQLKAIVDAVGWPTIALAGLDGSNAAMLLLSHSADHAWQGELMPELQRLADADKIDTAPLALLVDKELVAQGSAQLYGTQFKVVDGELALYAVKDAATLETRRARAMLPPMAEYKTMLAQTYGLKISDRTISGTASPSSSR